jgi:hypothetical protein
MTTISIDYCSTSSVHGVNRTNDEQKDITSSSVVVGLGWKEAGTVSTVIWPPKIGEIIRIS